MLDQHRGWWRGANGGKERETKDEIETVNHRMVRRVDDRNAKEIMKRPVHQ